MSISINGTTDYSTAYDTDESSAQSKTAKPTTSQEISQLAESGHSAKEIATTVGLPESIVDEDLGDTTSSSSATGQATALLALSSRLSVSA